MTLQRPEKNAPRQRTGSAPRFKGNVSAWTPGSASVVNDQLPRPSGKVAPLRLTILFPLTIAAAFFLIADIDAPRGGAIRVAPMNLHALIDSLR